jgi:hypothetical protein
MNNLRRPNRMEEERGGGVEPYPKVYYVSISLYVVKNEKRVEKRKEIDSRVTPGRMVRWLKNLLAV